MLAIIQRSKTVAKPPFHDHCHLHAHRRITGAVIPEVPWSRSTPVRPSPPPSWCSGPPVTAMRYKGARQGVTTSLTTDLTIDSDWSVGYFSSDLRHEVLWSWLVGWLVRWFVRSSIYAPCHLSKNIKSGIHEIWHWCSASVSNFTI